MMNPRPVCIHLGLPKTGTTCLQTYLFANHPEIYYFGKFFNGGFVPDLPSALAGRSCKKLKGSPDDIHLKSLAEQLAYAAENSLTPVLSKEGLAGGTARKKNEQAELFKQTFGNCKAVLFVREPGSFIKSFYAQMLKSVQVRKKGRRSDWMKALGTPPVYFTMHEWLSAAWHSKNSPEQFISYADTAEIYAKAFGRQNVRIFIFEDFVRNPAALLTQLCGCLEVDAAKGCRLMDGKRANDRITTGFADRLRALEREPLRRLKFRLSRHGEKRQMLDLCKHSGEKLIPEIPDEWLEKIHAVGDAQNRRLVNEWGLPLADYGYRL